MCFNPLQIGEARQGLLKHKGKDSTKCTSVLCQFESLQKLLTRQQWANLKEQLIASQQPQKYLS